MLLGPPFVLLAVGVTAWLALEWSPLLALATGPGWLRLLGIAALAAGTSINVAALRVNTGRFRPALVWPLGSLIFASALLRAGWLAHRRGGVKWRETFYPTQELLAARRFQL
jgi:hypothetical protein